MSKIINEAFDNIPLSAEIRMAIKTYLFDTKDDGIPIDRQASQIEELIMGVMAQYGKLTDEQIRMGAIKAFGDAYPDTTFSKGFKAGVKFVEERLQGNATKVDTKPMEFIVHDRDQEKIAVKTLIEEGYELPTPEEDIDMFVSRTVQYPLRVFGENGEIYTDIVAGEE